MILFVFEGKRREPDIFRGMRDVFFPDWEEPIVCSYGNNIFQLHEELDTYGGDGDVVALLKDKWRGQEGNPLGDVERSSDFSEIYLFFDYDPQNTNLTIEEMGRRISSMLATFDNETGNGKLYINYPMAEAIRYTKTLPDANYWSYTVMVRDCHDFKRLANEFSSYKSLDFIIPDPRRALTVGRATELRRNWISLIRQNVRKANYVCDGRNELPSIKDNVSQGNVFRNQAKKYLCAHPCRVAVLSSFPLFLYEYFKDIPSPTL